MAIPLNRCPIQTTNPKPNPNTNTMPTPQATNTSCIEYILRLSPSWHPTIKENIYRGSSDHSNFPSILALPLYFYVFSDPCFANGRKIGIVPLENFPIIFEP